MKTQSRLFGQNLSLIIKKKGLSTSDLADRLGYREDEIKRIIESRLFVNSSEKKMISDCLEVPIEEFSSVLSDKELVESGYMECRGEFSNIENREQIFDIFDAYCDIQELILHARETYDIQ